MKKVKGKNSPILKPTMFFMDLIIIAQVIMFLVFDIEHKPEALVNYVVTFIIICITRILASHYLQTIGKDNKLNLYYYGVIISLYLFSFSYTIYYTVIHNPDNKAIISVMLSIIYLLGHAISLFYGLYFIQFYNMTEKEKMISRRFLLILFAVFSVISVTAPLTGLYFSIDTEGYVNYNWTSYIGDLYPLISFVFSLIFLLRSKQTRSTKLALLSYDFYAMIFLVIDLPAREKTDITIDSGIAIGVLLSICTVFLKVYTQDKMDLAQKQAEIVEQKTQIMISQIQPHFLYNTLSAIYMLCGDNPKLAQKTIKDFSIYLRHNMNSINSKDCVSFDKELEHTKTYLAIEQLRFPDLFTVEYDIQCEDFDLPSLTLQPMVENAVKYGVRSRDDGGIINIGTYREKGKVYIVVKDNGMGFDTNVKPDDGRVHVGIENTKHRVEMMCNGDLTVESILGEGTTVTIILEDKNEYITS